MPVIEFNQFYRDFSQALDARRAALFIGTQISVAVGLKTWPHFLHEFAQELGLGIDRETDLEALAQYHVDSQSGLPKNIPRARCWMPELFPERTA